MLETKSRALVQSLAGKIEPISFTYGVRDLRSAYVRV